MASDAPAVAGVKVEALVASAEIIGGQHGVVPAGSALVVAVARAGGAADVASRASRGVAVVADVAYARAAAA